MAKNTNSNRIGYNIRCKLYPKKLKEEIMQDTLKPTVFYSKVNTPFSISLVEYDGIQRSQENGSIITMDLKETEIKSNDKIMFNNKIYTVANFSFNQTRIDIRNRMATECIIWLVR